MFKQEIRVVEPADIGGELHIPLSQKAEAARIYKALKRLDKDVRLSHRSCITEESELLPPEVPKKRGGRPPKIVSRRPLVN